MLIHLIKKILPDWMIKRMITNWDRDGLKKYFANTSWLVIAKIISFIASFATVAIVARYLGPENYGKLSYAQSFVAILSILASLGIDQVLYRDLMAHPERENEILGTAFLSKLTLGILTIIIAVISVIYLNVEPVLTWLVLITSFSFIIQPFGVVSHIFAARVKSKYTAYLTISVSLLIPLTKLIIVWLNQGILYFAAILLLETIIYSIGSFIIYSKIFHGDIFKWSFSLPLLKDFILRSTPLALASLSGYIYGRIDQVMILKYIDATSVGIYDIAVRLTEYLGYVPGIIIASLFPAIMNARARSSDEYQHRWKSLTVLCLSITTILAAIVTMAAKPIILMLFGEGFKESIPLLQIYSWSIIGSISIVLIQQYLIAENKSRQFLYFSFVGASGNIFLNYLLIPIYGVYGSAFATLITMFLISGLFLIFFKRINNK